MVRVTAGARLHFGFCNLSLSHERLYGGFGVGLDAPTVSVVATPDDQVTCSHPDAREYASRAVDLLDAPGASVSVERSLPRHAGLGSGTQLALATLTAVARAYDREARPRQRAPILGRGGRSGVGVATFEDGGFVMDAGHPTARFTTDRPADGEWTVPAVSVRHRVPDDWRFLVVVPDVDPGRSGSEEDRSMRNAVERADPDLSDRIAGVVTRRVLPAVADGSVRRFGGAVAEVGRLNGAWYADEQGGVYRPPVGDIVARLDDSPAVYGAGQSSWGPTVYGVTDADHAEAAADAGRSALEATSLDGTVAVVAGRNSGRVVGGPPPSADGDPAVARRNRDTHND